MQIQYFRGGNFFETAFYNPVIDDFDIQVTSATSTRIVVVNPGTGVVTTFTGTGFPANPVPPLSGTLTAFSMVDAQGQTLATITGISWGLQAALTAIEAAVADDALGLLQGLLSLQPITLDASAAVEGLRGLDFTGVTSDITVTGSNFEDEIRTGEGDDRMVVRVGDTHDTDGGAGRDTVDFSALGQPLSFQMDTGATNIAGTHAGYEEVQTGFGNDTVNGSIGADTIRGGVGVDQLRGGGGADVISGEGSNDFLYGAQDNDTLYGGINNDSLDGGSEDDELFGGTGRDTLRGQENDDILHGEDEADELDGGLGRDTLFGGAGNDTLFADGDGGQYFGGADADELRLTVRGLQTSDGGTGFDMISFVVLAGDQSFDMQTGVSNGAGTHLGYEHVVMGSGSDTVNGSVLDDLILGGTGNDTLNGGAGRDTLFGGDQNDLLNGGTGSDTMEGGFGNDTYIVDAAGDAVTGELTFGAGGGIDTVISFVNYVAPANIEVLRMGTLDTTMPLNGTGNDAPGTLVGNAGANILNGRGGNDRINGNAGNDTLIGGEGADTLTGGGGADTFVFSSISNSRAGVANRDVINGFDRGATQDRIDLSAIDANTLTAGVNDAFSFIGGAAFSATGSAGQLRLVGLGGANAILVEGDINGDRVADFQVFINGTTTMVVGDFIL